MSPEKYQSIVSAAWCLAEEAGLSKLEPIYLSLKTEIPVLEIEMIIPNQALAIQLLVSDVLTRITPIKSDMLSDIDNLFDTIMAAFDTAQLHRKAIQKIWYDLPLNPLLFLQVIEPIQKKILEISDLLIPEQSKLTSLIDRVGLQAIFVRVFLTWVEDETLDLSKTMAILDQTLKQYGRVKEYCSTIT